MPAPPFPPPPLTIAPGGSAPGGTSTWSSEYGSWARNQPGADPDQRMSGPGAPPRTATTGVYNALLENTGSLTGHILAQGRMDRPAPRSDMTKMLVLGLILLTIALVVGLLAATVAGDAIKGLFGGVTG